MNQVIRKNEIFGFCNWAKLNQDICNIEGLLKLFKTSEYTSLYLCTSCFQLAEQSNYKYISPVFIQKTPSFIPDLIHIKDQAQSDRQANYYQKNKTTLLERQKEYTEKNKEKRKETLKSYYQKNKKAKK